MSKTKIIRCKTEFDVIVVKEKKDLEQFMSMSTISECGHSHRVVTGDVWFARPKK